jgi:hypothetical protein
MRGTNAEQRNQLRKVGTMTIKERFAALQTALSKSVGYAVEFTIRGDNEFTLSAEGDKVAALKTLLAKLPGVTVTGSVYDQEIDYTCCFFTN